MGTPHTKKSYTSEMFIGCFGAGCSLPEWMPRVSATALWRDVSIETIKLKIGAVRLFSSHELVKVRRPVFIVTFVSNNACKTFLDQLFGYISDLNERQAE